MRTKTAGGTGVHMIACMIVFCAIIFAVMIFPVKVDAAGGIRLCNVDISAYQDGQWHSQGSQGSPSISGWKAGRFKLSADGATLYFDNFHYSEPVAGTSVAILSTERNMTIHVSGNNTFGNNSFVDLYDDASTFYDLTLEGDGTSNSTVTLGTTNLEFMTSVQNFTFRNCSLTSGSRLYGSMRVESGYITTPGINSGNMVITGGTIDSAVATDEHALFVNGSFTMQGGTINVSNNGSKDAVEIRDGAAISGGSLTCSGNIWVDVSLKQTGGNIITWGTLVCSGGRMESKATMRSNQGIECSGNGSIKAKDLISRAQFAGYGGNATATGNLSVSGDLTLSGASVEAQTNGVDVGGSLTVKSGSLTAANTTGSSNGRAISVGDSVSITGGKVTARRSSSGAIEPLLDMKRENVSLASDIWISEPSDGCLPSTSDISYVIYKADGTRADEVTIQKVTGIEASAKHAAIDDLYSGDFFDPAGLVLNVSFGDGSQAELSYNDVHKDMFGFNYTTNQDFAYGIKQLNIRCFGMTAYRSFTVKALGKPVLSGTTTTNSASLSWTAADGAQKYRVFAGDAGSGISRFIGETTGTSFTETGLSSATSREYTVYAARTSNNGSQTTEEPSNTLTLTTATEQVEPDPESEPEPEVKPAPTPAPAPQIVPPKKDDPSGAKFNLLQARAAKVTKTSVGITWKKVAGAKKYVIYGNKCGTKNKYKKLTTTTKLSKTFSKVAGKKVKKGTYYKFIVYAVNGKGKVLSTSKTVHVATPGGKVGNDKKVTTAAKKNKVTLKKGKTFKLRAKAVPASRKLKVERHRKMAYETSNKKIATVSSKGVIKGVRRGTCYVYAYTQNGKYARIKVTVK